MEQQGKIVSLELTNFMSIREGLIEFDDNNIITLCGYNDSGKSAITRLLEVMFYNAYPQDQTKFITDGEEFWKGSIKFSDGVTYNRLKYLDGKSEWELYNDGKLLFTNRLENGSLAAMPDTPEVIAKYLGVIQDEFTEEKLNVRRNTDKLFLINTTGGDNYKILNSVLQSDVLAEASRKLNEDKNKLNSEVINLKATKEVLENQVSEYEVAPEIIVDGVREGIQGVTEVAGQLTRLTMLSELRSQLNSMVIYEEVDTVDLNRLKELTYLSQSFNTTNIPTYNELGVVDIVQLQELMQIASLKNNLFVPMYDELGVVSIDRFQAMKEVGQLYNNLYNANVELHKTEQQLDKAKKDIEALSVQYNYKVCKNCGTLVD